MLVLGRKKNQTIKIGDSITITVVDFGRGNVRIGIDAPKDVKVSRPDAPEGSPFRPAATPAKEASA